MIVGGYLFFTFFIDFEERLAFFVGGFLTTEGAVGVTLAASGVVYVFSSCGFLEKLLLEESLGLSLSLSSLG